MPVTYPPAAPTISGDIETISRFLNTPTLVQRRLRTLAENRFIADSILQNKVPASGGAVLYEQTESIFPSQTAGSVAPGAEFPLSAIPTGPALLAAVKKWGLDAIVTDEAIRRQQTMNPVDRALTKLVNGVVKQVDSVAMTAINSAITQTAAAAALWSTSTTLVREITAADAAIRSLNQGYEPDTIILSDVAAGYLTANDKVLSLLPREWQTMQNPIFSGYITTLLKHDVFVTPNLPVATLAIVCDRTVLGGLAEEVPLTSTTIRQETRERWRLRAKRVVVPFVQEPNAGYKITGVA